MPLTSIEIIEKLKELGLHEAAEVVRDMARRRSKYRSNYLTTKGN